MPPVIKLSDLPTLIPVIWPAKGKETDGGGIPHFHVKCPAGFFSPAADYAESRLDLNDYLVKHQAATFIFDVVGDSMKYAGIFDGDKIVVDRAVEAKHWDIVVAILNGEHTVKRLYMKNGEVQLRSENPIYRPITLKESEELHIFGVVVGVVRKL